MTKLDTTLRLLRLPKLTNNEEFKKHCFKATEEELQLIITNSDASIEISKLINIFFMASGIILSYFTFLFIQSPYKSNDLFNTVKFAFTAIIFAVLHLFLRVTIVIMNGVRHKKIAEFELINREKKIKLREDRLKAKYLSKR